MKILIAPDKFKGSLSAKAVGEAIAKGLRQTDEKLEITFHPMADGGDGSLTILKDHLNLEEELIRTCDPLGRPISTKYFRSKDAAFIEVASASGLVLLKEPERNPLATSTLGTGEQIRHAISKGYQNIFLFLGGSATNDAGMGIAQALGFQFLDVENNLLQPIGKHLSKVAKIQNKNIIDFGKIKMTLFYDVTNPLFGQEGAAYVYAHQKGANKKQIQDLDKGLRHFSNVLQEQKGMDVSTIPGGGAAGGIGAGLVALCGAELGKGFDIISKLTDLEQKIKNADWVISGEGKLDEQSLQGKVIDGIAALCQKHQKPLSLFVGKNDLDETRLSIHIQSIFSIMNIAKNSEDAMLNAVFYLEKLAKGFRSNFK